MDHHALCSGLRGVLAVFAFALSLLGQARLLQTQEARGAARDRLIVLDAVQIAPVDEQRAVPV